jgi:hypothetical protein
LLNYMLLAAPPINKLTKRLLAASAAGDYTRRDTR